MQPQSSPSEIPEKKVTLSELPRARKMGTGEMITSKKELTNRLKGIGVTTGFSIINEIFKNGELELGGDYKISKPGTHFTAIFISPDGVIKLLEAINNRINKLDTVYNSNSFH